MAYIKPFTKGHRDNFAIPQYIGTKVIEYRGKEIMGIGAYEASKQIAYRLIAFSGRVRAVTRETITPPMPSARYGTIIGWSNIAFRANTKMAIASGVTFQNTRAAAKFAKSVPVIN